VRLNCGSEIKIENFCATVELEEELSCFLLDWGSKMCNRKPKNDIFELKSRCKIEIMQFGYCLEDHGIPIAEHSKARKYKK